MLRFEDLDTDEQRNEILKGIHNQLAQINKWLEVIAVRYAKLNDEDVNLLKERTHTLSTDELYDCFNPNSSSTVGYTKERGLYIEFLNGDSVDAFPLGYGEYDRTAPLDEDTGCFVKN